MFKTIMLAPSVWESIPNRKHKNIANIKQFNMDEIQVQLHNGTYLVFEGYYINNVPLLKKVVQLTNEYCRGKLPIEDNRIQSVFSYMDEYHENGWQKQKYIKFHNVVGEYIC